MGELPKTTGDESPRPGAGVDPQSAPFLARENRDARERHEKVSRAGGDVPGQFDCDVHRSSKVVIQCPVNDRPQ